jgi:hypothetical protein
LRWKQPKKWNGTSRSGIITSNQTTPEAQKASIVGPEGRELLEKRYLRNVVLRYVLKAWNSCQRQYHTVDREPHARHLGLLLIRDARNISDGGKKEPEIWAYHAQTTGTIVCQKGQSLDRAILKMNRGLYHLEKNVLESTLYLLPLASKNSFTKWYAKPSRAPTLICLPCCAILACSKVGTWD